MTLHRRLAFSQSDRLLGLLDLCLVLRRQYIDARDVAIHVEGVHNVRSRRQSFVQDVAVVLVVNNAARRQFERRGPAKVDVGQRQPLRADLRGFGVGRQRAQLGVRDAGRQQYHGQRQCQKLAHGLKCVFQSGFETLLNQMAAL